MSKYFGIPFASGGDKTEIPDESQPDNSVSFEEGWSPDYSKDQTTDPTAKDIPRESENYFKFSVTEALKEIQERGFKSYSALVNYPVGAVTPGSDNVLYQCNVENGPDAVVIDPVGDTTGTWVKALDTELLIVITPINVSPTGEIVDTTPTLVGSEFRNYLNTVHNASEFRVATDEAMVDLIALSGTLGAVESWVVSPALDPGDDYYWDVRYQDTDDTWSSRSVSTSFTIPESDVQIPTNLTPVDLDTTVIDQVTLTASAFVSLPASTHAASQWQITTDATFSTIDFDSGEDLTNLLSFTQPGLTLNETDYHWRVRYKSDTLGWSSFSTPFSFTTVNEAVQQPTNVTPVNGTTDVDETVILVADSFTPIPASGQTHTGSQWQVGNSDFSTIYFDSGDDATNLETVEATGYPEGIVTLYWRVRYKGSVTGFSAWSTPSTFISKLVFFTHYVAIAHAGSPYVTVYLWGDSGFGTKFSDPSTLPVGTSVDGVDFSPDGDAIAVVHTDSPYVTAYPWSSSGFGTKFSNPATLPAGTGYDVDFNPDSDAIAVTHNTAPYVTAYPWSSSGFGTKFSNPATLPTAPGQSVDFSPDGDAIAVGHASSPYVTAYPWSSSGFGTKFSNPATLPPNNAKGISFSHDSAALAVVHDSSPYVSVYPWNSSGFGTKFTNPATLPAGSGRDVTFNPDDDVIAVGYAGSPYVSAYGWSTSGFGTKFTNPATLPVGTSVDGVDFSPDGDAIAVVHTDSPYVTAYPWSSSGFGTKFSNPATLPAGTGYDVSFGEVS